jgi:hypothetical protein
MKVVFFLLMLISTSLVYSNEPECDDTTPEALKPIIRVATVAQGQSECTPQPRKLRLLCSSVGDGDLDANPETNIKFRYHRHIYTAACVDPAKDEDETIAKKIVKIWNENEDQLNCNNSRFDVVNGNVIKYAVSMQFDEFLLDVTRWKVNLNKVDDFDDRTPLDYISYKMNRMAGTPSERILKSYYDLLRNSGAKHKSEL